VQTVLVRPGGVFGEVLPICIEDLGLNLERRQHRPLAEERAHCLRHAAYEEIRLELLEKEAVGGLIERCRRPLQCLVERCVASREHELGEGEWVHVEELHSPHWK